MHLIQILLPLYDNEGSPFRPDKYQEVREELSARFGGLTAFSRAPAEGLWQEGGKNHKDDIVVYEVMTDDIADAFWTDYRRRLEQSFRQQAIIIRAQSIQLL